MDPNLNTNAGIVSAIGATPLVRLDRIFPSSPVRFFAKLEALNPGGSVKDRAALNIVGEQVASGRLVPGRSVVVESSSGNLGIGLAQACRWFGLRFICVVDPKTTPQNLAILHAYGAELEMVTDPANDLGDYLATRIRRVRELVANTPNAYWPNQYENPLNAHAQQSVMREIVDELDGQVDYIVIATGSCGTINGCARFIRDNGLSIRTIAVDAAGSAIFGQPSCQRLIPGHGSSIRPALCEPGLADEIIHVTDQDCVVGCRRLVTTESILCGGSSGAVVSAIGRTSPMAAGSTCALVLPDRGERYLDSIYSDTWVKEKFGDIAHLWKESS